MPKNIIFQKQLKIILAPCFQCSLAATEAELTRSVKSAHRIHFTNKLIMYIGQAILFDVLLLLF